MAGTEKRRKLSLKARDNIAGYLFLLPNILGFIMFSLIPVVTAFVLAFTNWDGMQKTKFIGLKNFIDLFQHDSFLIALKNTFVYTIGSVPLTLIIALAAAILLNQKLHGVKIYRSVFYAIYFFRSGNLLCVGSSFKSDGRSCEYDAPGIRRF